MRRFSADFLHGERQGEVHLWWGTDFQALTGIYAVPTIHCCESVRAKQCVSELRSAIDSFYDDIIPWSLLYVLS